MEGYVEICGTPIEVKSIKDFRVVKKEYIFRPVFEEIPKTFFSPTKYIFKNMEPYAAIIDGKNGGFMWQKKKYECVNAAGRKMLIELDEVPILVYQADGHASEVFRDNPHFAIMGKQKSTSIEFVEALVIRAKEEYVFYGNNIHLFSVLDGYNRIKAAVEAYRNRKDKKKDDVTLSSETENKDRNTEQEKKAVKSVDFAGRSKAVFGKIKNTAGSVKDSIGNKIQSKRNDSEGEHEKKNESSGDSTGDELRELKQKYERGEMTKEEFNLAVNQLLSRL